MITNLSLLFVVFNYLCHFLTKSVDTQPPAIIIPPTLSDAQYTSMQDPRFFPTFALLYNAQHFEQNIQLQSNVHLSISNSLSV